MIVSLFHVTVPAEAVAPFERSWQQRAGKVDAMPGFRGLEVLRAGETPGKYIVLTR
jgi:heme-degrading monooxygenase HmoA